MDHGGMPPSTRGKPVTSDPDRGARPRPRRGVTSDPDRGLAVNSGTDPQRPGEPSRPVPSRDEPGASASESSVPSDRFDATHQPASPGRGPDVEGARRDDTSDETDQARPKA